MTDAAHMKKVVESYIEAISTENFDTIRSLYADNGTVEDPVGSPAHEGIEAIMNFYNGIKGLGVKLTLTGAIRCAGNSAAFPFKAAIGPTTMEVIDVFEFDGEGKVISMKAYWGAENRY